MFKVIPSKDFYAGFDPNDPMSLIPAEAAFKSSMVLATQIDVFVRACLKKMISDEILELYITDRKEIPGVDMIMELINFKERKITVKLKEKELGHASFISKIVDPKDYLGVDWKNATKVDPKEKTGLVIIHEVKDVVV